MIFIWFAGNWVRLGEVKSASLQGDIVIIGDFFLFYTNLGGEGRGA